MAARFQPRRRTPPYDGEFSGGGGSTPPPGPSPKTSSQKITDPRTKVVTTKTTWEESVKTGKPRSPGVDLLDLLFLGGGIVVLNKLVSAEQRVVELEKELRARDDQATSEAAQQYADWRRHEQEVNRNE